MAAGPLGYWRLCAHGCAHPLAVPASSTGLATVCRQPALGDTGGRGIQRLGARRCRPWFALLGPCDRMGGALARLAGLHRTDHGLPHLARRTLALTTVALGRLDHVDRPWPAHTGLVGTAPRQLRLPRTVRRQHHVNGTAHHRLPPRRSRSDRLRSVPDASLAPGQGRRAASAAMDRIVGGLPSVRRGGSTRGSTHPR